MKKILIFINTIILCFSLVGCKQDEILYKDEILKIIFNESFKNTEGFNERNFRGKNYLNILSRINIDLDNDKFYEGRIIEKKVIAGYCDTDTIDKLQKQCMNFGNIYDDYSYLMLPFGQSNIYYMFCYLNSVDKDFNVLNYKTHIYTFDDGIPINYKSMNLNFVLNYYKIKLHTGRIIVAVGDCHGEINDYIFYPYVINFNDYDPINYGEFIYLEKEYSNVADYQKFRMNIIVKDYKIECKPEKTFGIFAGAEVELFNYFKSALSDDTVNKEYNEECIYKFDYNKLKELLIK